MSDDYTRSFDAVARIAGVSISAERVHACLVLAMLQGARTDDARLDVIERQLQLARLPTPGGSA